SSPRPTTGPSPHDSEHVRAAACARLERRARRAPKQLARVALPPLADAASADLPARAPRHEPRARVRLRALRIAPASQRDEVFRRLAARILARVVVRARAGA